MKRNESGGRMEDKRESEDIHDGRLNFLLSRPMSG